MTTLTAIFTRSQLSTAYAQATYEIHVAEHQYREARATYEKFGGDALYDEAETLWIKWTDASDKADRLSKELAAL